MITAITAKHGNIYCKSTRDERGAGRGIGGEILGEREKERKREVDAEIERRIKSP